MPVPAPVLYPPFNILRLSHVEYRVTDLARSRAFYVDTLGLQVTHEDGEAIYLRALRFTNKLEAGMIWVNSENVRHLPTPFGGVKASGIGRDGGDWSFEFYMEQKHIGMSRLP